MDFNQDGATSEEMWDLIVLLNRELRSTKLKLRSSSMDVKRLQEENEALSARLQENSEDTQRTHCAAGSCKSVDEVNALKQAKEELESALVKSQKTCAEQAFSIVSLKAELEDTQQQNKMHKLHLTALQNEVLKLKDILLPRTSQPANGDASNDNALFIPAELRPVLSRFPPPDISDRPKPSKPCTLYQPNENPEIPLPRISTLSLQREDDPTKLLQRIVVYQHAFYLMPSLLYDALNINPWCRNQALSTPKHQRYEVMYSIASPTGQMEVHYAGTYECKLIGRLSSSEYMQCSDKLREELCQGTVVPSVTGLKFNHATSLVRKEYENGTKEISFAFLQCVGFNHPFYRVLRDGFKEEKERKRPATSDGLVSRMKKKARTKGTQGV